MARCRGFSWHMPEEKRAPVFHGRAVCPSPLTDGGWKPLAPSPIPFRQTDPIPAAMSLQDIVRLKEDFTSASLRALGAGFELIEIHAAHGYLLHSFLSPLSNQRNDRYGGSFENRIRLLMEDCGRIETKPSCRYACFRENICYRL